MPDLTLPSSEHSLWSAKAGHLEATFEKELWIAVENSPFEVEFTVGGIVGVFANSNG